MKKCFIFWVKDIISLARKNRQMIIELLIDCHNFGTQGSTLQSAHFNLFQLKKFLNRVEKWLKPYTLSGHLFRPETNLYSVQSVQKILKPLKHNFRMKRPKHGLSVFEIIRHIFFTFVESLPKSFENSDWVCDSLFRFVHIGLKNWRWVQVVFRLRTENSKFLKCFSAENFTCCISMLQICFSRTIILAELQ